MAPVQAITIYKATIAMFRSPISFIVFVFAVYLFLVAMSSENEEDPVITVGNKQVHLSQVNKPHNVVVGGVDKPIPDLKQFPDVLPEAKEREEKLAAERAERAQKETE